jgi:hypothetical protein
MVSAIEAVLREPEKRIWLWGHPRCRSTAIERAMMQRKDMTVIEPTEPFINLYYNGPERRSDRNLHAETASKPWRLRTIVRLMMQKVMTPYVFSKNMAYYLTDRFDTKAVADLLYGGVNTFIIRDPRAALPSHYHQDPNFNREEAGYGKLRRLFDIISQSLQEIPLVIDGDAFCRTPESQMQRYCLAVGIPYDPQSMHWESEQVKAFDGYGGWTEAAENSTGFQRPPEKLPDLGQYPHWVKNMIDKCRNHYEYLLQFAIKQNGTDLHDGPPKTTSELSSAETTPAKACGSRDVDMLKATAP